jgi:hypothetical protein
MTWHPGARRVIIPTAPQNLHYTGGGHKLVWHTTEGNGIDGAVGAYKANGNCPHFTIEVIDGKRTLYQHLPLEVAASALRHDSGPATNTANCIQVEIVGFAGESGRWPMSKYHYLHLLATYCHRHFNVPLATPVDWSTPHRLSGAQWVNAKGHVGHVHCPGNDHTDPGTGFHIGHVLRDPL